MKTLHFDLFLPTFLEFTGLGEENGNEFSPIMETSHGVMMIIFTATRGYQVNVGGES